MGEQTRAELIAEKAARAGAESHAALLTEEKELERNKLKELEEIKEELEQLLEEEKQAKRDEEIVRTLQARMLTEEWEKREILEKLQEEQKEMLDMERSKREEFESVQEERERKVREAEKRIRDLEDERKKLDDELKKHKEKTRRINIGHEVLEAKMKVKEQECEKESEAQSRVTSLNSASSFYLRARDNKTGFRPMRSASMRETSYSRSIKSKLKVLTCNIGHILGIVGAEKGLDHFRSTPTLTFEQYRFYLQSEIFSDLPDEISVADQRCFEKKIDEVCWVICNPPYLERSSRIFSECCVLQLWRIFCMLGEMVEDEDGRLEVVLAASEVETIISQFMSSIGKREDWDAEEFDSVVSVISGFKFSIFLAVIESKYARDIDNETLIEAVKDLHDMFLLDVIKKGKLKKQMVLIPAFREHWCVVQPRCLSFYSSWEENEKRGDIPLDSQSRVEAVRSQSSSKSVVKSKPHRFYLHANQKSYEFQATNHRSRLQWMSAVKKAIDNSGEGVRYQVSQARQRRVQREEDLARRLSHLDIVEQTRAELIAEKAARAEAESHAALLTEEKELERNKLKELEEIKEELEQLLEEEKQAKRDEEIVRTLQARMLTEEWEKREILEKLQEEQKEMLDMERSKREEFESIQEERERKVREAEKRIRDLEDERKKLDDELKKHKEKTRRINIGHEVLEAKMKVKEQECEKESEAQSRITSLNSASSFYLRARDNKTGFRPMRSASMRETSYSRSIRRRTRNDSVSIRSNCNIEEVNNNSED